jgi:hypothetical protein
MTSPTLKKNINIQTMYITNITISEARYVITIKPSYVPFHSMPERFFVGRTSSTEI